MTPSSASAATKQMAATCAVRNQKLRTPYPAQFAPVHVSASPPSTNATKPKWMTRTASAASRDTVDSEEVYAYGPKGLAPSYHDRAQLMR